MATARGQRVANIYNAGVLGDNKAETGGLLKDNAGMALAALGQGQGAATNALTSYGGAAYGDLSRGFADASTQLNIGRDQAQTRLDGVNGMYQPYAQEGAGAVSTLGASLRGDNSGFKASDNYNFTLGEALKATNRQASAMGRIDSGGTLAALNDRAAGLASGEINNWQGRLQGLAGLGMQANDAMRANTTNQANLDYQQGQGQAGLATARGAGLASIQSGLGSSLAGIANQNGAAQAGIYSNLGNSLAGVNQFTTGQLVEGMRGVGQAGDAAKSANQQTMVNLGTTAFSALMGMPMGGGGGGGGGTGGMPANMGWLSNFAGT